MLEKDVKIGMKVTIPIKCTYPSLAGCFEDMISRGKYNLRDYATVKNISDIGAGLSFAGDEYCGCGFSDFEPYIEPVTLADAQRRLINREIDKRITEMRQSIPTLVLAGMAKQTAPQEDKPLTCEGCKYGDRVIQDAQINKPMTFEVGETVKFRDDLIDGKMYDGITYWDLMKDELPKTFALPKINGVRDCHLNGWCFPLCTLEKVPQPAKHEVFIDGLNGSPSHEP